MITVLALALAAAAVAAVPRVITSGRMAAASPRLLAATHLVALTGLALLPAGGVVCAGLGLAAAAGHAPESVSGCGSAGGGWLLPGGLALVTLAPLGWQAARIVAAARRTELAGMALAGARPRRLPGGPVVWVLPSAEPAAYVAGVRHPKAVVTSGLLALLDPDEQRAVCEHEAAHLRLGHPRLLLFGAAVARAYRFLPPVRRAWSGLRRELEAAADDQAARAVGTAPVLSALARVTLARAAGPGPAAGPAAGIDDADPGHLRYRLARLQQPRAARRCACALVAAGGLTLAMAFTWSACGLATGTTTWAGLAACGAALAVTALRPMWPSPASPGLRVSGRR
ncbi:MAG TPA: M56 family metallopeptidase [Streptosporangiaceae bacterium]|nr:M56 family metallopeptidase [Streptosporangiaceae bacterium]